MFIGLRGLCFEFFQNHGFGSLTDLRDKTACLLEGLFFLFEFEKFEVLMFGFHIVDKSFEDSLLGDLNLRSGLRIQLKRKMSDFRFVGVSCLIGKEPFGGGYFFMDEILK